MTHAGPHCRPLQAAPAPPAALLLPSQAVGSPGSADAVVVGAGAKSSTPVTLKTAGRLPG